MTKFIELTDTDNHLPVFINVETICAIRPYDDDSGETAVYISGPEIISPLDVVESYEEVKAKIKRSGVISCNEIMKRRKGQ